MQKAFIVFLVVLGLNLTGFGQQVSPSPDQLFKHAQSLAFTKHWKEARATAFAILKTNPHYLDARVLIANTYAWDHQFDSARVEISKVFAADSSYRDALGALINIDYWSGNLNNALNDCNKALSYYPHDPDILKMKAKILLAMGRDDDARAVLSQLLQINPNSFEVNSMLAGLKKYHNHFNVEHTFDFYNVSYVWRWHMTSIQYQRDTKKGVFIGKLNTGQLVSNGEHYLSDPNYQVEVDAYPILNPTTYIYLNYGYSPNLFFPRHRIGIEPFKTFRSGWEVSGGFRFLLIYDTPKARHGATILTGSLGKYFSNNWISFRPYLTFAPNHSDFSSYLFFRHYLNKPENYLGGMIGYGVSPDDKYYNAQLQHFYSNSYHVRLDLQHQLSKRFLLRFMSEYIYEEYLTGEFHSRFVNDLYISFLF